MDLKYCQNRGSKEVAEQGISVTARTVGSWALSKQIISNMDIKGDLKY